VKQGVFGDKFGIDKPGDAAYLAGMIQVACAFNLFR
jgi:hypothetical protein